MAGKISTILLFIMKYTIACINGPNLNLQGSRKKDIYGGNTLADIYHLLSQRLTKAGGKLISFQSNHEGAIIDYLQKKKNSIDGIIINPGPLRSMVMPYGMRWWIPVVRLFPYICRIFMPGPSNSGIRTFLLTLLSEGYMVLKNTVIFWRWTRFLTI